jgi:hypothetical protein
MIGIYCTLYLHTVRDYTQYSALAILHTSQFTVAHALGFSVFTSRILATDISQSHCNFKSHAKCSFHSLIPFLPLFCSCQFRRLVLTTVLYSYLVTTPSHLICPFITPPHGPHRKHSLYFYGGVFTCPLPSNGRPSVACLLFPGMRLPSRCIAMGIHVTISIRDML